MTKKRTPRPKIRYRLQKTPFVVLLFFLALWMAGVASGEPSRVLEQAWQICLSCIGIG